MKKVKANRKGTGAVHTPKTQKGMGDFYGSGLKNPIGKMRESQILDAQVKPSKLKKPPKSYA